MIGGRREFPALDSVRAVASLAVVVTHVGFQTGIVLRGAWGAVVFRLDVGVAIFFVLSGFLLTRPFVAAALDGRRPPGIMRFYLKRFLRIYPVYVVSVALALLVVEGNDPAGGRTWIRQLTFAQSYVSYDYPAGLTQMWSLATEVAFYALLPVIAWLLLRRVRPHGPSPVVVGGFAVGCLALTIGWHTYAVPALSGSDRPGNLWLPAFATWFAAGAVLSVGSLLADRGPAGPGWARLLAQAASNPGTCLVGALSLLAVASTPIAGPIGLGGETPATAITKNLLYTAIAVLVVLPATAQLGASGWYERVATSRVLRHVGHLSYSIFCCHLVVLYLVFAVLPFDPFTGRFWIVLMLTVAASLALSEALYWAVERPAVRLKERRLKDGEPSVDTSRPSATTTKT